MATDADWAKAFRVQAGADLLAAKSLSGTPGCRSVFAMLLQMSFEKYAKAALIRTGQLEVRLVGTHRAAIRFVDHLKRNRELISDITGGGKFEYNDVLAAVQALTWAQPQVAGDDQPKLEYPWEDATGAIGWPERDLSLARDLTGPHSMLGPRVIAFATYLDKNFDTVFR